MEFNLQVSSNIISGLDVLLVDLLLVSVSNLITHSLFRRLKMKKLFVNDMPDQLGTTSAGNLSIELLGHRRMALLFVINSLFVIALASATGFGITGTNGFNLGQPVEYLHADLSQRPLNITDFDSFVVEGHEPNRKTLWGGVFHQQDECRQLNMSHITIFRMATNITSSDSSAEDGIWPPRSMNRTCLDPTLYVDADQGKTVVSDSVLYVRRRFEPDTIGDCHLFFEGTGEVRELEEGKADTITETFTQPTVLRNCVPEDVSLESNCAKGLRRTACIVRFTTGENLDLLVLATWNPDQVVTETNPEWRNMVVTDVTHSDRKPALSLTKSHQWRVAQMIAGDYVTTLTEAVIASNSVLIRTLVQRQMESVAVTRLSVRLFFIPLGLIVIDIIVLVLALVVVTIQLRLRRVVGEVNVAADAKELLQLVKEMLSPTGTDKEKKFELVLQPLAEEMETTLASEVMFSSDVRLHTKLGIIQSS